MDTAIDELIKSHSDLIAIFASSWKVIIPILVHMAIADGNWGKLKDVRSTGLYIDSAHAQAAALIALSYRLRTRLDTEDEPGPIHSDVLEALVPLVNDSSLDVSLWDGIVSKSYLREIRRALGIRKNRRRQIVPN